MEKGAVVGRLRGPLPTFVGLLYAAQMRISTAQGQKAYRFSCPAESLRAVGVLHQALCSGELPALQEAAELAQISFLMDYPDSFAKKFLPFGRAKADRGLPELQLGVVPLAEGAREGELAPAAGGWGALIGCKVLVVVAELSGASGAAKGPEPGDGAFARLIAEAPAPKPQVVVVFQLPDEPAPAAPVNEGEKGAPAVPPVSEAAARVKLGSTLTGALLPRLQAALAAAGVEPAYVFSWVALERGTGGAIRAKRRQLFDAGGVEPEYPFDEFQALVTLLGRLAA